MFYKIICSLFCLCMLHVESFADRKPGDVVTFYNATSNYIKLDGTNEVQAQVNTEIGKKSIDFSEGDSDKHNLTIIKKRESQAHLLSMEENDFVNKNLLKLTNMDGSDIAIIKKGEDLALKLQQTDNKYILSFYRHTSGNYALIVSEDLKTHLEKEQEVLRNISELPDQWKKIN